MAPLPTSQLPPALLLLLQIEAKLGGPPLRTEVLSAERQVGCHPSQPANVNADPASHLNPAT